MPASPVVIEALLEARRAEKDQAAYYRALAARAEQSADVAVAERLNGLLADEQHHLSRLSARLLELGASLPDLEASGPLDPPPAWEEEARRREQSEVQRYESLLELELDRPTAAMIRGFLDVERRHADELGGKWTNAAG